MPTFYKPTEKELKVSIFEGAHVIVDGVRYSLHEHPKYGDNYSICMNVNGTLLSTGFYDLCDAKTWQPELACPEVVEAFYNLR